ncbi:MAG: type IV pilus assembly protein PilM [Phycisphaerales bacterium]
MAANVCWGVEVGAGALKAVKLQRDGENITVADFVIVPHKRVLSTPEIDEKEARRVALGTLVSQFDLTGAAIAVSVPGHSSFARFAKLPPVEPKKIPDIVKFEAVQQIPFPIDDVQWDYQTFVSEGSPDVEVGIFAVTTEKVMEKLAKWQDVGKIPDLLTLSPLAAFNAIAYDQVFNEKTPGTIILDIGTVSTDLIVADGGRIWIRTFPIGGHQFTEALVTAFNLSYVKAEKLKREAETSSHSRHILQAMRPVFGDLAQDVQRSIGYYQSLHRDAKLTRLIGLGSTFNLPGLRKFLSQQLSIEVVRLDGFSRLKHENTEKNTDFQAHAMELATAAGLALQGLGAGTLNANLMPVAVAREAIWAGKTKWFAAAAGLAIAAGAAMFVRPLMDSNAFAGATKPAEIDRAANLAKSLKAGWATAENENKPDARAVAAMSLLENRAVYGYLTSDVAAMMNRAQEAATDKTKIVFGRLQTDYLTGASAAAPTDFPDPRNPAPAAPPIDPNAAGGDLRPRVHMKLEVNVVTSGASADANADKFINSTMQDWLFKNAKRGGIPYTLDKAKWVVKREKISAAPGAGAGANPNNPPPQPNNPAPRPPGPRGGRNASPGDGPPGSMNPMNPMGERGPGNMPAPPPAPNAPAPGAEDVNKLAPAPSAEPLGPEGSTVSTYTIEWDALITPPAVKEAAK